MTKRPLTRIPPKGRRAIILRTAMDQVTPLSDIVRFVRTVQVRTGQAEGDPSIDRLKTREAVRDLRRAGLLRHTPHGYQTTPPGAELYRASQVTHG